MQDGYVPRGGIFDGDSIIGQSESYWGPPVRKVPAVPVRVPIHQRPNFAHVGVAPFPRSLGADVWNDPLCQVNSNLPWCNKVAAIPQIPVSVLAASRATQNVGIPQIPAQALIQSMATQAIAPARVQPPAGPSRRPSTMDSLYRSELIGRGHGIFEQSVLACPTTGGHLSERGGIFDGPTIDEQCGYADREQRQVPQARRPEQPIQTDAPAEAAVAFGYGPDGLGWYRRY